MEKYRIKDIELYKRTKRRGGGNYLFDENDNKIIYSKDKTSEYLKDASEGIYDYSNTNIIPIPTNAFYVSLAAGVLFLLARKYSPYADQFTETAYIFDRLLIGVGGIGAGVEWIRKLIIREEAKSHMNAHLYAEELENISIKK